MARGHLPVPSDALTAAVIAPPRVTETNDAGKPAPKNRRIQVCPEKLGHDHRERGQYRRGYGAKVGSGPVIVGCAPAGAGTIANKE